MEALQQFEDLLLLQKKFLPYTAAQVPKTCEEIILICNILGMVYLKKGIFATFNEGISYLVNISIQLGREFPDVAGPVKKS